MSAITLTKSDIKARSPLGTEVRKEFLVVCIVGHLVVVGRCEEVELGVPSAPASRDSVPLGRTEREGRNGGEAIRGEG